MLTRRTLVAAAAASLWQFGRAEAQAPAVQPVDPLAVQLIRHRYDFAPNEIHVFPNEFALLWTLPNQKALRYPVGIGRPGLYEAGEFFVGAKKEWPAWTPTNEMIAREPQTYAQWKDGMPGGEENPLGARALYLFVPGRGDTFLRIHGTNQPRTIGHEVSNGCARLVNPQIIDLYRRVPLGARVVLYSKTV